ncbi:MAG: hypothetical protein ACK5LM_01050, partial [Lactovum sp.]
AKGLDFEVNLDSIQENVEDLDKKNPNEKPISKEIIDKKIVSVSKIKSISSLQNDLEIKSVHQNQVKNKKSKKVENFRKNIKTVEVLKNKKTKVEKPKPEIDFNLEKANQVEKASFIDLDLSVDTSRPKIVFEETMNLKETLKDFQEEEINLFTVNLPQLEHEEQVNNEESSILSPKEDIKLDSSPFVVNLSQIRNEEVEEAIVDNEKISQLDSSLEKKEETLEALNLEDTIPLAEMLEDPYAYLDDEEQLLDFKLEEEEVSDLYLNTESEKFEKEKIFDSRVNNKSRARVKEIDKNISLWGEPRLIYGDQVEEDEQGKIRAENEQEIIDRVRAEITLKKKDNVSKVREEFEANLDKLRVTSEQQKNKKLKEKKEGTEKEEIKISKNKKGYRSRRIRNKYRH